MSRLPFKIAGLGVPAGGTGTLLRLLEAHPEVATPIAASTALATHPLSPDALASLRSQAAQVSPGLPGIYLTSTFGQPHSAERISTYLSDARLVMVVRDPIECLMATYEVAKGRGQVVRGESCAEFIARQGQLQTAVRYSEALADLYSYYGPQSLCLVLYDDLRDDPVATLKRVYTFLDIDPKFVPSAIAHYVKSDDEPKRAWWWRLGALAVRPIAKRFKQKPIPVVPPTFQPQHYFSAVEYDSLYDWYRSDLVPLSTFVQQDMVAKWDRGWGTAEAGHED